MPKGHSYTQQELIFRKKDRAHSRYQLQQQVLRISLLQQKIDRRFMFACQRGKVVVSWTVQEELQLLAHYKHICVLCDRQKDDLDLIERDPAQDFCISNMLPVCYGCLIDKYTPSIYPHQIELNLAIKDLPDGFNKERLLFICQHDQVHVYIAARLRKYDFEALIGNPVSMLHVRPSYRYAQFYHSTPQLVLQYGFRLFETEARALFPQYKHVPYHYE